MDYTKISTSGKIDLRQLHNSTLITDSKNRGFNSLCLNM